MKYSTPLIVVCGLSTALFFPLIAGATILVNNDVEPLEGVSATILATTTVSGTIGAVAGYVTYRSDLMGNNSATNIYVQLKTSGGSDLDCYSSTETLGGIGAVAQTDNAFVEGGYHEFTGFSGTQCLITADTVYMYYLYVGNNSIGSTGRFNSLDNGDSGSSPVGETWIAVSSSPGEIENTQTRIDYTSPPSGSNVSSTTPITLLAGGYVEPEVAILTGTNTSKLQIRWNVYSNTQSNNCIDVICIVGGAGGVAGYNFYSGVDALDFEGQLFNVASTTGDYIPLTGYYTLTTSIIVPNTYWGLSDFFGIGFGDQVIVSTTTQFTVGTPSAGQTALNNIHLSGQRAAEALSATSSEVSLAGCSPLTFDISSCMASLFFPSTSQLSSLFEGLKNGLFSAMPWGYITRFMVIASGNATTTLPSLVFHFADAPPPLDTITSGATLDLTPWPYLLGTTSMLSRATSTATGQTFRQIVEPGWNMFVYLCFFMLVVHEILGIVFPTNGFGSRGALSDNSSSDDSYRLKEWLYKNKK